MIKQRGKDSAEASVGTVAGKTSFLHRVPHGNSTICNPLAPLRAETGCFTVHDGGAVGERTDRSQEQERAKPRDQPVDALRVDRDRREPSSPARKTSLRAIAERVL